MADPVDPLRDAARQRTVRRVILIAFACLLLAVLGMLALGVSLLRS